MARIDELRLLAKVARMYHEQGLSQQEIADQLDLSQSGVSRLLKRAENEQVVRVVVMPPPGTYTDLEEALQERFGLKDVIIVDSSDDDQQILRDLGAAAAYYLEHTLRDDEIIGISSWSETLLAMVRSMHPLTRSNGTKVVQILGGVGNPAAEVHATHLTRTLADVVKGEAVFLPAPGVAGSKRARDILLADQYVREAVQLFPAVTLALVGIGSLEPSRLLASSGNVFSEAEIELLQARGAVGDICLNFFDDAGRPVKTPLDSRVISVDLKQLAQVRRCVGIAGGQRKQAAIHGALSGGLINVLITDLAVARNLLSHESSSQTGPSGKETEARR